MKNGAISSRRKRVKARNQAMDINAHHGHAYSALYMAQQPTASAVPTARITILQAEL